LSGCSASQTASLAHAIGDAGLTPPPPMQQQLLQHLQRQAQDMSGRDAASALWGLASMEVRPEPAVMNALLQRAAAGLGALDRTAISDLAWVRQGAAAVCVCARAPASVPVVVRTHARRLRWRADPRKPRARRALALHAGGRIDWRQGPLPSTAFRRPPHPPRGAGHRSAGLPAIRRVAGPAGVRHVRAAAPEIHGSPGAPRQLPASCRPPPTSSRRWPYKRSTRLHACAWHLTTPPPAQAGGSPTSLSRQPPTQPPLSRTPAASERLVRHPACPMQLSKLAWALASFDYIPPVEWLEVYSRQGAVYHPGVCICCGQGRGGGLAACDSCPA
jgi:hypothetical protein